MLQHCRIILWPHGLQSLANMGAAFIGAWMALANGFQGIEIYDRILVSISDCSHPMQELPYRRPCLLGDIHLSPGLIHALIHSYAH